MPIISGRHVVVKMILGFKSKILVVLIVFIKNLGCSSITKTMQSFPEILILEFAKSRAKRAIRASVVYVLTCPCANVPKARQLLIFKCRRNNKRAKSMPIFQFGVPTCQKACHFFNFACQKAT